MVGVESQEIIPPFFCSWPPSWDKRRDVDVNKGDFGVELIKGRRRWTTPFGCQSRVVAFLKSGPFFCPRQKEG